MEGGSQEAEGHKSMGGRRTWYRKWEAVIPCPPPLPLNSDISTQRHAMISVTHLTGLCMSLVCS